MNGSDVDCKTLHEVMRVWLTETRDSNTAQVGPLCAVTGNTASDAEDSRMSTVCVHTYIHTYVQTYIHTHMRTYIHTYVVRTPCIHTYIHTYTHIHT
jgi:hypothetical protein